MLLFMVLVFVGVAAFSVGVVGVVAVLVVVVVVVVVPVVSGQDLPDR